MRLLTLISVSCIFASFACQDSITSSFEPPRTRDLSTAEPPATSGIVIRFDGLGAFLTIDSARGLTAIQGIDVVEACQGNPIMEVVEIQRILNPNGPVVELLKSDELRTSVWPFTGFSCALFTTTDPLAVGTSSLIRNDNDIFVSGTRTNSFGWRGHGVLNDGDGEEVRFHNNVRLLILKDGTFKEVVSDIFLN